MTIGSILFTIDNVFVIFFHLLRQDSENEKSKYKQQNAALINRAHAYK